MFVVTNHSFDVPNFFDTAMVKRNKGEFISVTNCDKPTA